MASTSRLLHRVVSKSPPVAVSGRGAWITDELGRSFLDGSSGAAVSCLGHGEPRVIAALQHQAQDMTYVHSGFFSNRPAEQLAAKLSDLAPGGPWRVLFVSGGSEANEAAMKLARQIHVERGDAHRTSFVARHQSYHGATLATLALSGNPGRRKSYEAMFGASGSEDDGHLEGQPEAQVRSGEGALFGDSVMRLAQPCYAYRHQAPGESLEEYGLRAAESLKAAFRPSGSTLASGPSGSSGSAGTAGTAGTANPRSRRGIAGVVAETVVGATLGAVPPVPGYFKHVRRACDEEGALLILDEVMCGMGRTGSLFAYADEGIVPDMVVLAKGLGAGYAPIGALLVREDLAAELDRGSGQLHQGHTYMAHATACATANAVLGVIESDALVERVKEKGPWMQSALQEALGGHVNVGDIRGRGYFWGVEIVADRATKQPFCRSLKVSESIKAEAMENGLLCYPGSGSADGSQGDHVLLAPPFISTDEDLEFLVEKFRDAVEAVCRQHL